jgi:hypothetical protein
MVKLVMVLGILRRERMAQRACAKGMPIKAALIEDGAAQS